MPSTDLSIIIKAKDEASAKFKNLGQIIKQTEPSFMALAAGSAAVAGGVALIGAKAVKMAAQFQAGMANVSTLVNTAEVDMGKLGGAVLDMSKTIPKSAADLTAGLYQVISAGVKAADSTEYLGVAAKAATAGLATTEEAVNAITTVIKGYGMEAGQAMDVSDQLFQVVKLGQTTFSELAAAIGRVVPLAAALDVQLAETNALFATLTGVTGNTNEVSTQAAAIMRAMIKPTEDMAASIKKVGKEFNITTAKGLIGKFGLVEGLKRLIDTTDGTQESVAKLFGRAEALTAIFALTGSQSDIFKEKMEALGNAAGSTEEAFKKQMETFTAQWTIFKNVMTTIWIKIGDQLLPVITKLVQSLKGLADGFSNLSNTQAKYIVVIGSIVGAAAGLIAAFSGIMLILPSVIAGVKALGITLTFLATNPISLAIIAIGAIAAITYGWYKATEDKISQIDKELSQIDTLTKRYNELIGKTKRTKEETAELKEVSTKLNGLMPGLIKNTKDFSKAQKISAEQVEGHTEKLEAQKASLVETGRGIKAVGGIFVGMGKIIVAAIDSIITQIVNMAIIGGRSFLALLDGAKSVAFAIVNFRRIISGELKLGDVFAQAAKDFGAIGEGVSDMRKDAKAGFLKMVDDAANANKKWRDTWAGKPAKAEIEVAGKKVDGGEVTPPPEVTLPLGGGGGLTDEELAKQKKLQEEIRQMNAETKSILLASEEESYKKRIDIINNEASERTKALERRKAEEPALAKVVDAQIIAIETERKAKETAIEAEKTEKIAAEKQKLADRTLAIQEETEDTRISLIENAYDKEKAILEERHQDKIDKIEQELEAIKGQSDEELTIKTALLDQLDTLQEEHNAQLDDLEERRKEASQNKWEEEHQIAVGFMNTTQSALASGIASMINGTKSFAEAVKGIWQSIAGFVVEQISQMIAKWLVFKALTAMAGGGGFFGGIAKGLLGSFQTQPGEWRQVPFDMPAMVHEDELIGRPPFPVSKSPAMTSQPTTIIENHYNISPHFSGIFPNDPEFYREITLTHMVPIIKEANENVSGSILD